MGSHTPSPLGMLTGPPQTLGGRCCFHTIQPICSVLEEDPSAHTLPHLWLCHPGRNPKPKILCNFTLKAYLPFISLGVSGLCVSWLTFAPGLTFINSFSHSFGHPTNTKRWLGCCVWRNHILPAGGATSKAEEANRLKGHLHVMPQVPPCICSTLQARTGLGTSLCPIAAPVPCTAPRHPAPLFPPLLLPE